MEKSLKLYLSLICLLVVYSCKNETPLNADQKRELARKIYNKAIHFTQGSTPFQNGIVEALAIDPTFDEAAREVSVAFLKRGIPHKWKPLFEKVIKLNPAQWHGYRGCHYLWFYRDYKKAIADFDATDTLTPNFTNRPQGHSVDYWRGIAYLGLKDYKTSISYFEKHISDEIKEFGEDYVDVTAYLYLGIANFEAGNFDEAILNFENQLKYSRNLSADAKYYKAKIYKSQDKFEEAEALIDDAIDDFDTGYFNHRDYVEILRQIYYGDLEELKTELNQINAKKQSY
jgi:tetratricopeptide (TPR) repeat protein